MAFGSSGLEPGDYSLFDTARLSGGKSVKARPTCGQRERRQREDAGDQSNHEGLRVYDLSDESVPLNPPAPAIDPRSGRVNPAHHIHQPTDIVKRIYRLGDQQAYRLREAIKELYETAVTDVFWRALGLLPQERQHLGELVFVTLVPASADQEDVLPRRRH